MLRNWFDTKSFLFFMVTGTICQIVMLASLTVMRNNWFVMLEMCIRDSTYTRKQTID